MCMVAKVALPAVATLEEIASLRLVYALCHAKFPIPMRIHAIYSVITITLHKGFADLRFLQIRKRPKLGSRVRILTRRGGTFATLKESTHFRLCELQYNRVVTKHLLIRC